MLHRKDEDGSSTAPYSDGPIEILPKIWLGAEDNARDWRGLATRKIGSILNVAKEVSSPFELTSAEVSQILFTEDSPSDTPRSQGTYYPADGTGRPALHYLKLEWSHAQSDLVQRGFPEAMAFVDQSLARGEGVLIQYVLLFGRNRANNNLNLQLPMRNIPLCHSSDCPCHACCFSSFALGPPRSVGFERDATGLHICQAEK